MNRYRFEGAVMDNFGKCIENKWKAETVAPSSKKAMSNLAFQWKKENNMAPYMKIELDGRLIVIN